MILIIPSAVSLNSEMQSDTGSCTHALINIAGKPLFFHIIEGYKKLCQGDDLIVILVVKTGVKKLLDQYEKYVDKYQEQLENVLTEKAKRLGSLKYKLKTSPVGASIEQGKISKLIISEEERYDKKINAFIEKIDYWQSANKKFSFIMEEV